MAIAVTGFEYALLPTWVAFHVDDAEKAREAAEAKGLDPTPIISPEPAVKFFFVKDPNGLDVQFIKMR